MERTEFVYNILEVGRTPVCPECGYALKGLPTDRCPECGATFDLLRVLLNADYLVRKRVVRLQNAAFVAVGGAAVPVFVLLFRFLLPLCVLALPAFVYAGAVVVLGIQWRFSRDGRRLLASSLPVYREEFSRSLVAAVVVWSVSLITGALLLWLTWREVLL